METNELSIVITTFKSELKIFTCLDAIPSNIKTIVVENSNNESFKKDIEKKYKNVNCILTGENKGYAKANNIGLSKVKTEFALVLNPDAILEINAIENFLKTAIRYNDFWIIGPGNDQGVNLNFKNSDTIQVNNLKGFAIFLNIPKFKGKFFDENFFLYFEEIDLCMNVKKNGGKIYLSQNIIIKHEGASSVNKLNKIELEKSRNWHWMWSTFYFHKKYKGIFIASILISPKFLSSLIKVVFYTLTLNKEKKDIYYFRLSGILNSIIGKKSWYRPSLD